MSSFFKTIGLYDTLNFNVEMGTSEFAKNLKKITYETNTTFISLVPDNGIPTRFEYRGTVNEKKFMIKRRKHFFDFTIFHSIIKGNFTEENNQTVIRIEFTPFIFYFISFIIVPFFLLFIILSDAQSEGNYLFIAFMLIITSGQYFALKRSIKRDKYDFLRELNFIAQKNNQFKNHN